MAILFYDEKDPFYEFSNFYMAEVTIDGISYPSTEYYYQAQKFMGPDATPKELEYAKKIRDASTSNKAYYLAKQVARGGYSAGWYLSAKDKSLLNDIIKQSQKDGVKPRADWELVKDNIMRKGLWAKFNQHSNLKKLLKSTGSTDIVENSPRDAYWGIGKDGDGKNMLGRILQEIRAFLLAVYPKAPTKNSNWVVPDFILASAYPGAKGAEHVKIIDALMNENINVFVSLQEEKEAAQFNSYSKIIAPDLGLTPYKGCDKVWSQKYNSSVIFVRIPIKDRDIVSDPYLDEIAETLIKAVGKHFKMLIHCFGGKGRTGTVVGIMLGKMYGMNADEVLMVLTSSFKSRINKGKQKPSMPQCKSQFAQIRRMLTQKPMLNLHEFKTSFTHELTTTREFNALKYSMKNDKAFEPYFKSTLEDIEESLRSPEEPQLDINILYSIIFSLFDESKITHDLTTTREFNALKYSMKNDKAFEPYFKAALEDIEESLRIPEEPKLDINILYSIIFSLFEDSVQTISNRGQIRIGKKISRGVVGKNPHIEGFKNIDVTSGSGNKIAGNSVKMAFSPMLIGPVIAGNMVASKFENYWQYSKVFPDIGHMDANGEPTVVWHAFRKKGFAKDTADRHPVGTKSNKVAFIDAKGHNHYKYYTPAYSVFDDIKYDYIESRKKIYAPVYAELIRNTNVFKELKKMVDAGENIQILDLDGPHDGDTPNMNSHLVTVDLLKKKINDPTAPFGHGYVVAALLSGIELDEFIE